MAEKKDELALRIDGIKSMLVKNYQKQIVNFLGDEKQALKFLSGMVSSIQRLPKLAECTPDSLINSFMIMAQMGFMPSAISGEAYVLPYENKNKGVVEAQFQIGYPGIATLLYGAGAKSVVAEVIYQNDTFSIVNGSIHHEVNPFITKEERGVPMGAYAIITTQTDGKIEKFMRKEDILKMGEKFSKSWSSSYSPWKQENDPELWMWRKTVLKQCAKLAPKNERLNIAIAEDNKDSIISDRIEAAKLETGSMTMGALTTPKSSEVGKETPQHEDKKDTKKSKTQTSDSVPDIDYGREEVE